MLRVWERAEDNAAPRVPDDIANAAGKGGEGGGVPSSWKKAHASVRGGTHKMYSSLD